MGAALSLARQGFSNITVWEQAPYLDEVGAGINIPPNLGRILTRWGVMGICKAEGVAIQTANVYGVSGQRPYASRTLPLTRPRGRDGRAHLGRQLLAAHAD